MSSVCFDDDTDAGGECGDGSATLISYEYDKVGRRTATADNRGVTTFAYVDLVNLTQRTEKVCSTVGTGSLTGPCAGSGTLPAAGATRSWTYDDNGRLTDITSPDGSSPIRLEYYADDTLWKVNWMFFLGVDPDGDLRRQP